VGGSHPAFARSHKSLTGCGPLLSVSDESVREEDFKTALEWRVVDSDTESADFWALDSSGMQIFHFLMHLSSGSYGDAHGHANECSKSCEL
jgi:hypothetical protein